MKNWKKKNKKKVEFYEERVEEKEGVSVEFCFDGMKGKKNGRDRKLRRRK